MNLKNQKHKKVDTTLVPTTIAFENAAVMEFGAEKHGPHSWITSQTTFLSYIAAIERHLLLLKYGEDVADDSKLSHLAHISMNCAILYDAQLRGILIDDRLKLSSEAITKLNQLCIKA